MNRTILFFIVLLILSCSPSRDLSFQDDYSGSTPKNVILMVGDGMGIAQITATMYSKDSPLSLESFPVVGLHKNTSADDLITDSAAGATAFACGKKTYNGAIAVDTRKRPMKTLLEEAEANKLSTGLVATSTITHATPASFIAHQPNRKDQENIAADFLKTDIDLFIGGGKKYFSRRNTDDRDLIQELRNKGYVVSDFFENELKDFNMDPASPVAYFTADEAPLPSYQGRDYLSLAAERAAAFLKARSDNGFFMMVEGSQIDWGGHANNADWIISEGLDFDKTIQSVLEFAKKDGETLVIVTADHETGGFSINKGSRQDSLVTSFTSDYHTLELIPVFAYGPGSSLFAGIYENTAIYHKIRAAFGWK